MVWFHEHGIANCLSLALISDIYRITLDTSVTQSFFLHRDNGLTRRFDRMTSNLYACDVRKQTGALLVTSVDGQKQLYSDLYIRRAKAARKLQEIMGFPSNAAFMKMIDTNAVKNCPVTRRDVIIANDIYGVNPNILKGKMVRTQPGHTREDILPVP